MKKTLHVYQTYLEAFEAWSIKRTNNLKKFSSVSREKLIVVMEDREYHFCAAASIGKYRGCEFNKVTYYRGANRNVMTMAGILTASCLGIVRERSVVQERKPSNDDQKGLD